MADPTDQHAFLPGQPPDEARIRDRAYYLWLEAGMPHGQHAEHWAQARQDLAPASVPTPPVPLRITAHVQNVGDLDADADGWAGLRGSGLAVEGLILHWDGPPALAYQAIWSDADRSDRAKPGEFCGTRGQHKSLRGILVAVDRALAPTLSISGEAYFTDGTRLGEVVCGSPCVAASGAPLEAFRLQTATH